MEKYKNKEGISLNYSQGVHGVNISNKGKINYNRDVHKELIKEVVSEAINILNMYDKNCTTSMKMAMTNTKKFLRTNFDIGR